MAKDILFGAQFKESKLGKTGLTVTFSVYSVRISDLAITIITTSGSGTEVGKGLYVYKLSSADLQTYYYFATALTATTTVDDREIAAVQLDWVDRSVGVTASTVSDKTGYALTAGERTTLAGVIWDSLLTGITAAGSVGKLIKDYLDAAVSSRSTYAGGDTAGTTTLLSRLSSTRAAYLDALQYVTDARLTWLERLGTALEETSVGSGIWRLTVLALSRVGLDITTIKTNTQDLPTLIEGDGTGGAKFTVTALSNAPSGGGGGSGSGSAILYGTMLSTYSEAQSVLQDFAVNVGEDTWIESKVVDEDGRPVPLDAYTLTVKLTGSGGFTQDLDNTEVIKIVDSNGANIDGRYRWRAHGTLTSVARRNVRHTLTMSGGTGNVRTALTRVQVEG